MSNAPYRHSDGSNCYTKNCSRGHQSNTDTVVISGDANAYIEAKATQAPKNKDIQNFFETTPTIVKPNYQEINELNSLRRKYFYAINNGQFDTMTEIRSQLASMASSMKDTKFIPKLVLEGKCGIDGCSFPTKGGMAPDHYAGVGCKSGSHNHCTCNACF